jgi:phosphoserine phosphatase
MTAKAIIFDIDGTLSPEISWLALTRDLGASVDEHIRIYTDLKQGRIDYPESKRQLINLWRATGNANKAFFQKLFENWPQMKRMKRIKSKLGKLLPILASLSRF